MRHPPRAAKPDAWRARRTTRQVCAQRLRCITYSGNLPSVFLQPAA